MGVWPPGHTVGIQYSTNVASLDVQGLPDRESRTAGREGGSAARPPKFFVDLCSEWYFKARNTVFDMDSCL